MNMTVALTGALPAILILSAVLTALVSPCFSGFTDVPWFVQ